MGLTGAPTFLEGRFGFLHAFCGPEANSEWLTRRLGIDWEMRRISFKPYPTNGFLTAVVDAAVGLRNRGCRPDDVREAVIFLPPPVLRTVAEPREQKVRPKSPYGARFSAPFVFALALRGGGGLGLAIDDFTPAAIEDESLLALAERVSVVGEEAFASAFPGDVPTLVRVETVNGETLEQSVPHRRGGIHRALSDKELYLKFKGNAATHLPASAVESLYQLIWDDSAGGDTTDLLDLTIPTG
jgi:2-methylcitrate dehydratase PrpD